jgi:hypothetical protein
LRDAALAEQHRFHMRRVRHHDDDDVGTLRNLPARFADHAAGGDKLRRNRRDVVEVEAMLGGLEVTCHRASHGAEADKADIDHFDFSLFVSQPGVERQ